VKAKGCGPGLPPSISPSGDARAADAEASCSIPIRALLRIWLSAIFRQSGPAGMK
jgi:hypothetical protein